MWNCKKCLDVNPDSSQFCQSCGEKKEESIVNNDELINEEKEKINTVKKRILLLFIIILMLSNLIACLLLILKNFNTTSNINIKEDVVIEEKKDTEDKSESSIGNKDIDVSKEDIITGRHSYTGQLVIDGLVCKLKLDYPISYHDPLDSEPVTSNEILLDENLAIEYSSYNGLVMTLEGELFNYRGSGILKFTDNPMIINVSGAPQNNIKNDTYVAWDSTDNEKKFNDAIDVIKTVIYQIDSVDSVDVLYSEDVIQSIKSNGFSYFDSIMIKINGNWIESKGYEAYITPKKDCVMFSMGPNESPEIPCWTYSWAGKMLRGDGSLEEYIITNGLL